MDVTKQHRRISWEEFERLFPNHQPLTEAAMADLMEHGATLVRIGEQPVWIDLEKADAA